MRTIPPSGMQRDPESAFSAGGSGGELEIGLAYLGAARIPEEPLPRLGACARLKPDLIAFAELDRERVHLLSMRQGHWESAESLFIKGVQNICSHGSGSALAACPVTRRLVIIGALGVVREIQTPGVQPWSAARWRDGWLIVDADIPRILLLSDDGTQRQLPTPEKLLTPRAAIPLDQESYLYCDRDGQVVSRWTIDGRCEWTHGEWEHPAADAKHLTNPEHITCLPDGRIAVCDVRNSRIIFLAADGALLKIWGGVDLVGGAFGHLWAPIATAATARGLVIVDSGNGRLIERIDQRECHVWGEPRVAATRFHHPRSCDETARGYLVADSYRNRVVEVSSQGALGCSWSNALGKQFFWPRNAARTDDEVLISDGRNARILRAKGTSISPLTLTAEGREISLRDPHAIRPHRSGLVVTDTGASRVYHADPKGNVLAIWGAREKDDVPGCALDLSDVHDACFSEAGELWICDTGNHRLLKISLCGRRIEQTIAGCDGRSFNLPKSIEVQKDGTVLVCDSANHRVVRFSSDGRVFFRYGGKQGHATNHLSFPRQARQIIDGSVLIADYLNNRLLRLPAKY